MDALWPEVLPATAPAALRALVSKVRTVLGPDVLVGRGELALALPASVRIDVEEALDAVHRALSRNQALDVYDVFDEGRWCRCVAKTLRPDRAGDVRALRRLRREGRLLARMTHPHIVRAYETLEAPRTIVVLETLTGETLDHLIGRRSRRLAAAEVAILGLHVGSAIRYMHAQGHLHLDLKPSNVTVDGGIAKLLDLSLARPPTRSGPRGVGTRRYMAPEQARGGAFTAACDVWGLGTVLYEAAAGRAAYEDDDRARYPQLERRPPSIRRLRRLPRPLAHLIDSCLESEPGDRPDLTALLDALESV
jgi:eukaryotic-like serine/threonine-protein kinase